MEVEQTQNRSIKPAKFYKRHIKHIRAILYVLLAIIVIVILGLIFLPKLHTSQKTSRSNSLDKTIASLKKNETCNDGINQINPEVSKLGNSTYYNIQTRETALNYLVTCTFVAGNTNKALSYSTQLEKLYLSQKQYSQREKAFVFAQYMEKAK